jgi:hypothetical protein
MVSLLFPVYVSICAALLIELRSNIKFDLTSILYFIGLVSFFIACYISNRLSNRCNIYENIYITKLFEYSKGEHNCTKPDREEIYKDMERKIGKKLFQCYGVFIFGILGLFFVIFSFISQQNKNQKNNEQNMMIQQDYDALQPQIDFSKVIDIEQADGLN